MDDTHRRDCEALARDFAAQTGAPLCVPPSLAKLMRESGIDMTHVRETAPVPRAAA